MSYDNDKWAKYDAKYGRGESDIVADITSATLKVVIGAGIGLGLLLVLAIAAVPLWYLFTASASEQIVEPPQVVREVVAVAPIAQEEPKKEEIDPGLRYVQLLYALPDVEQQLFENTTRWNYNATFEELKRKHPNIPDELIRLHFQLKEKSDAEYEARFSDNLYHKLMKTYYKELEDLPESGSWASFEKENRTIRAEVNQRHSEALRTLYDADPVVYERWRREYEGVPETGNFTAGGFTKSEIEFRIEDRKKEIDALLGRGVERRYVPNPSRTINELRDYNREDERLLQQIKFMEDDARRDQRSEEFRQRLNFQ